MSYKIDRKIYVKEKRGFGTLQGVVQRKYLLPVSGKRDPEEGSLSGEVFCLVSASFFGTNKLSFHFFHISSSNH